jgi:hypothetical protein
MEIRSFTEETLAWALHNDHTTEDMVRSKQHFGYLSRYLGEEGLNAVSIVMEEKYVSKDFLDDYTGYYASCFHGYDKHCKRVHFFRTTITEDLMNQALLGKLDPPFDKYIWDSYLGFIVVRPIPVAVIGFTLLKDYNSTGKIRERVFPGVRPYTVHFFGKELKVNTLAFQEQDNVLAACATTAIWCMLSKASAHEYSILKSPGQITRDAASMANDGSRLFPNKGLDINQISQAIIQSGMVTELPDTDIEDREYGSTETDLFISNSLTKKIVYAYMPLGIPIILVINVPKGGEHKLHAITVAGYRKPEKERESEEEVGSEGETQWMAEMINQLYAHDDQWGPFTRVRFKNDADLITTWTEDDPENPPCRVTDIVVPLYPKVRITYRDIEAIVEGFHSMIGLAYEGKLAAPPRWDICIQYSETYKRNISREDLSDEQKLAILTGSYAKYLWVAGCLIGDKKIFEFVFDATDVNIGIIKGFMISNLSEEALRRFYDFLLLNKDAVDSEYQTKQMLSYYHFLLRETQRLLPPADDDEAPVNADYVT